MDTQEKVQGCVGCFILAMISLIPLILVAVAVLLTLKCVG
jgi:hypothetical protein